MECKDNATAELDRLCSTVYATGIGMRIGLLSDTHVPIAALVLPAQLNEVFRGVDLILHAGDVYHPSVLDELERIAPVLVAQGDDDYEILGDGRVKKEHQLTIEGVTISLRHDEPGLGPRSVFPEVKMEPEPGSYRYPRASDILVFGHSHMPELRSRDGLLIVNPGSPTFPHYTVRPGTVALLMVSQGGVEVCFVQL